MVEAGAKEVSEEQVVEALEAGARRDQADRRRDRRPRQGGRQEEADGREEGDRRDFYQRGRRQGARCRSTEAMRIRGKLENYDTRRPGARRTRRVASRRRGPSGRPTPRRSSRSSRRRCCATKSSTHGVRLDGRKFDEVRPIWIETGVLPRTHGSAVFTRGETQALVTCTLGTADDAQKIESFEGETWKSFMLHYNFPPFSVGEVGRSCAGPGRREVGHGALAERALAPMMPGRRDSSPTRSASSRTSSSRTARRRWRRSAAASLAMMDAGVPLKAPVAGIAMGLVMDEKTGKYAVLTRHRRRRGSLRRHGLQGRRHGRRHHRAADGHQGLRHHRPR